MERNYDIIQLHDADRYEKIPKRHVEYIIPDVYPMTDAQFEKFIKHEYNNKNIWRKKQEFMSRNNKISLVITPRSCLYQSAIECGRTVIEREKYIKMKIEELQNDS